MAHNVWRNTAVVFVAQNECATPLQNDQFSRVGAHIPRRGKNNGASTTILVNLRFNSALSKERSSVLRLLCAARFLKFALLSISSPEVPATVLRILLVGSGPFGTHHLGDRGDGIPVACGDRYPEEAVDRAEIADDLHVAPIHAKDESILSREDS